MSLKLGLKIDLRAILTGSGSFGFGSKKIRLAPPQAQTFLDPLFTSEATFPKSA